MAWGNKTAKKQEGAAQSQALAGARRKTIKGPSWEAQGLEEAGLNRILAITQPTGAANFNVPMGAVSSAADLANVGINALGKGIDAVLAKRQANLMSSQAQNLDQDTLKKTEETLLTNAQNMLLGDTLGPRIDEQKANTARAIAEQEYSELQRDYLRAMKPYWDAYERSTSSQSFRDALDFELKIRPYTQGIGDVFSFGAGVGKTFGPKGAKGTKNRIGF